MWTNQNLYFDLSPACKRNLFDVSIDGERLEFSNEAKYLGVTVDNKLNQQQHIEHIKMKLTKEYRNTKRNMSLFTGGYTCQSF